MVMGLQKHGKSTLLCSHPGALVFDWEGGASAVTHPRAYIADLWGQADPWAKYLQIKELVIQDARSAHPQFRTVFMDTADQMIDYMQFRFCQEEGLDNIGDYRDGRAGYARVRERFMRELFDFEAAGYGIGVAVHQEEQFLQDRQGGSILRIKVCMSDSFRRALIRYVDQIITITRVTETVYPMKTVNIPGKGSRQIEDRSRPQSVVQVHLRTLPIAEDQTTGCRVSIPDRLLLPEADGWTVYADAYQKEVAARKAELAGTPLASAAPPVSVEAALAEREEEAGEGEVTESE
jgi:hypothetical protein